MKRAMRRMLLAWLVSACCAALAMRANAQELPRDEAVLEVSEFGEPRAIERLPAITEELDVELASPGTDCECGTCEACTGSSGGAWYFRTEYFLWVEMDGSETSMQEKGVVPVIGWTRRFGRHRLRAEMFGSQLSHLSIVDTPFGSVDLHTQTVYYGGRTEYDFYFYKSEKGRWEWLVGMGTRMWAREIDLFGGVDQFWLTVYPYLGAETRRDPSRRFELFGRWRLGMTAFSLAATSFSPPVIPDSDFYPRVGFATLGEYGIRGEKAFVSGYLELFSWMDSPPDNNVIQLASTNFMAGVQLGLFY